jgi:signal transduction histidine kinase
MAMLAVTIAGMVYLEQPSDRIIAGILLAAFAIILFTPYWHGHANWTHIRLAILSALTAGLMTLSPGWNFFPILFFVLAPVAMTNLSLKTGFIWIGVFILISGAIMVASNGWIGLAILLPFAAGFIFFGVFGWMMMESDRNRLRSEQLLAELQTAHQQLQEYTARAEDLAIAQERNRIAREMHDTLGHRLTIASVQLEGAQRLISTNPERAASMIGVVREQVKEGLSELRRTVAMLRASVEEDLPLDKALMRLADQVGQATALKIHLSLDCPPDLSLAQQQALYRAAQEGLTNIQRHASASEAWLRLAPHDGMLELLLSDNGVGISAEQARSGFGLLGLKERAALQGGEFHVDARPGGGTQITFSIRLTPEPTPSPAGEANPNGGCNE